VHESLARHSKESDVKAVIGVALATVALTLTLVSPSEAACTSGNRAQGLPSIDAFAALAAVAPASRGPEAAGGSGSIAGLWQTTFFLGNGPTVWDEAFEVWHSDGTEWAIDNGVPPVLGNVCIGVWKREGQNIKLRHVTWNWNPDGSKAGRFLLLATVRVSAKGDVFSGTFVTDSFDLEGNVVPELHAEGVLQGRRITVD
jgi:hypothetical protein